MAIIATTLLSLLSRMSSFWATKRRKKWRESFANGYFSTNQCKRCTPLLSSATPTISMRPPRLHCFLMVRYASPPSTSKLGHFSLLSQELGYLATAVRPHNLVAPMMIEYTKRRLVLWAFVIYIYLCHRSVLPQEQCQQQTWILSDPKSRLNLYFHTHTH